MSHSPSPTPAGNAASSSPRPSVVLTAAVAALILCCVFFRIDRFPEYLADEGTWPYEVALWVETGEPTLDYYVAPGYHYMLGLAFRLFGADMGVARVSSVVMSLATLLVLHSIGLRLFGSRHAALMVVLLLGTHYEFATWSRRALIEPYSIFWLVLAVRCFLGRSFAADIGLAVACALLLLTKASGVFIFPAFAIALLYSTEQAESGRRLQKCLALWAGVLGAAGVFYLLSRSAPDAFSAAWTAPLLIPPSNVEPQLMWQQHRIGIDPRAIFAAFRRLTGQAPFLSVLTLLVFFRSLFERRNVLIGWWAVGAFAWVAIQTYKLPNYILPIYPALALGAVAFIVDANATAQRRRFAGISWQWTHILLAAVVLYSVGRLAGEMLTRDKQPSQAGVRWLQEHTTPDDRVAAAPYILLQIDTQDYWHVYFEPSYLPTLRRLQAAQVDYVVLDAYQWVAHLSHRGGLETGPAVAAFDEFGEVVFADGQTTIYRVHRGPESDTGS